MIPSGLAIRVATKLYFEAIRQVRLVPKGTHYCVEVIYERASDPQPVDPALIASVDIGVNNLAAITSIKPGFVPRLDNGRPLKSLNQSCNKRRAQRQARLPDNRGTSRALAEMADYRTRSVTSYLHTASRAIIDLLVRERIGTLVIGKNIGWKQEVNLGKCNNQAFVFIPHARFIEMLAYKATLVGIAVRLIEESYTSKCSFLDLEPIRKHAQYRGMRVKRGLFVASTGQTLNADVNGSYNILRKAAPEAVAQGVQSFLLRPVSLTLTDRRQDRSKQSPRRMAG